MNPVEDPAPRDVVPRRGLTREDVQRMNDNAGKPVTYTLPGELYEDAFGGPLAVGEPETGTAIFAGSAISKAEADRLGLTQEEIPRVHIID